jgi:hypothetical protein
VGDLPRRSAGPRRAARFVCTFVNDQSTPGNDSPEARVSRLDVESRLALVSLRIDRGVLGEPAIRGEEASDT